MTPPTPGENQGLIGATFGTYRIVAKLGEGGMGEVFRAHDSALRRDVALKMLTAWSADDPAKEERLARFAREARALAALNHPHIGAIFGVESHVPGDVGSTPVTALVLELVEGETLADRIRRGAIPPDEARRLAVQIAGALAAAHEKGLIHRDLKPANIKVTPAAVVKVLDFGLAKTIVDTDPTANTRTEMVTHHGTVLGTPAYMSPEQVRGQDVDTRTDMWGFGCVLDEMLTGQRSFGGATSSDCMSAGPDCEPDWSLLPSQTTSETRALLRRCLQKDRTRRLRDMGDVQLMLEDTSAAAPVVATPPTAFRRSSIAMALLAVAAAMLGGIAVWVTRPRAPASSLPSMRVEIVPSASDPVNVATTTSTLAMSRDGTRLAWASYSQESAAADRWWSEISASCCRVASRARCKCANHPSHRMGNGFSITPVDRGCTRFQRLEGHERRSCKKSGRPYAEPVGRTTAQSSTPQRIPKRGYCASATAAARRRCSRSRTRTTAKPTTSSRRYCRTGVGILFTILDAAADTPRVAVLDTRTQSQKVLIPGAASAHYIDAGYLVYAVSGTIFAVGFDVENLQVHGERVTLGTSVLMGTAVGAYYRRLAHRLAGVCPGIGNARCPAHARVGRSQGAGNTARRAGPGV